MRRNGRTGSQRGTQARQDQDSNLLSTTLSLLGGVGLGAGLLYLLDPEKGADRRHRIAEGAREFGQGAADTARSFAATASDYAGSAYDKARDMVAASPDAARDQAGSWWDGVRGYVASKATGAADMARDYRNRAGGYAGDQMDAAREHARVNWLDGESRAHRRFSMSICALSSIALGAAVMYVFDPISGWSRRSRIGTQAKHYARTTGDTVQDYASRAGDAAREYASQATDAIKSGVNQVRQSVGGKSAAAGSEQSQPQAPGTTGMSAKIYSPGSTPSSSSPSTTL